ncbi:MAG TPA: hypothetical protein VGM88_26995 [Kofleriaceae bacterium]|jgi:hypothetical protein
MMEADENDPEFMALLAKTARALKKLDQARPPLDNARNIEFLVGSDGLEGRASTSYAEGQRYAMGVGHAGALLDALALGASQRALRGDDLALWLEWISFEQDGSELTMGDRREALFAYAREVSSSIAAPARPFFVEFLADSMLAFRKLAQGMPHAGQLERLVANYLAAFVRNPVLVFGADEGAVYSNANITTWALRLDLSNKLREVVFLPGFGGVQRRLREMSFCDHYPGLIIERHEWLHEIERWKAADLQARGAHHAE